MKDLRQSLFIFAGVIAWVSLSACNDMPAPAVASGTCAPGTAQIAIWDGRIQKVCGCGGTNGEFAPANTALNCTFPLGSILHVYFHGPYLQHQLRSSGGLVMPDTPVFDPSSPVIIRAHAFAPATAGTFSFRDTFDATLFGDLVVTP